VAEPFLPILAEWGKVIQLPHPESQLKHAVVRARRQGSNPVALSFRPFHDLFISGSVPQVVYAVWSYSDVPDRHLQGNPRFDWVRMANQVALILTPSSFTASAFARAGVQTPVRVVPVPLHENWFQVPPWDPLYRARVECKGLMVSADMPRDVEQPPLVIAASFKRRLLHRGKIRYIAWVRPWLPSMMDRFLAGLLTTTRLRQKSPPAPAVFPTFSVGPVELWGIVYTSVVDPFTASDDWQNMLKAFILGLRDCRDATLFLKLKADRAPDESLNHVESFCRSLGVVRRCRIVVSAERLDATQMFELARATTFYVNPSQAEGTARMTQEMLAAGRPAICPIHSALTDFFSADSGFVVASQSEPTHWPEDPLRRLTTTWSRLVWQSLADQFRASYAVAKDAAAYAALSARARDNIRAWAAPSRVGALLKKALDQVPFTMETGKRAA
jgi:hypothetical protein